MVSSRILKSLTYTENFNIHGADIDSNIQTYEMEIANTQDVLIAIGKEIFDHLDKGIVYFPLYLIKDDIINTQIGLFEISKQRYDKGVYDEDGDVITLKIGKPLLFSNAENAVKNIDSIDEFKVFSPDAIRDKSRSDLQLHLESKTSGSPSPFGCSGAPIGRVELKTKDKSSKELLFKVGNEERERERDKKKVEEDERKIEMNQENHYHDEVEFINNNNDDDVEYIHTEPENILHLNIPKNVMSKTKIDIDNILKDGIFVKHDIDRVKQLPEEDKLTKNPFTKSTSNQWVQNLMENDNYLIEKVAEDGDCLFTVIMKAFEEVGKYTTVLKLRAIVAQHTDQESFNQSRQMYNDYDSLLSKYRNDLVDISSTIKIKKQKFQKQQMSLDEKKNLLEECNNLKNEHNEIQKNRQDTKELISIFFGAHFGNITTLDKFKAFKLTKLFWADEASILTLEKVLNIKIIVLSQINNNNNVEALECGLAHDSIEFTPDYYIISNYRGDHYETISYKNRKILEFAEIPYHLKTMIIKRCMSNTAGPYAIIKDFKKFKQELGILDENRVITDLNTDNLYDSSSILSFFNKSADKKPGKGFGETIKKIDQIEFNNLSHITNWRRIIDDSWLDIENPFTIDSNRYASVMHYYQGSKFKNGFADFFDQFSLDSNSAISKDVALCISAASKPGKFKINGVMVQIRPINTTIDGDFYTNNRNVNEREKAINARFEQNVVFRNTLLKTNRAQLNHYIGNKAPELAISLMKARLIKI
jgi:hypothetical protein